MAFHQLRGVRNKVYVYYHSAATNRLAQVPRELTQHLDGHPEQEIEAWIRQWESQHGRVRERSNRIHLGSGDKLTAVWIDYQTHRGKTRKRGDKHRKDETTVFESHIVPFFVGKHQRKDPTTWHNLVPGFHTHLFGRGLADATVRDILWTLRRFGEHLVFQRQMSFPFAVQAPARENRKVTPLKVRKSPDDIVAFVARTEFAYQDIDFGLAILLSYFGALRPSELFALEREDFLTGKAAEDHTRTLEGFREQKLGSRLSVVINKTLKSGVGQEDSVKSDMSRAVVNIWHPGAARTIAELLKARPSGRLFPFSRDWLERAWCDYVKPKLGTTPHDLRRASALFLGREKRIPVTLLQEHMRHAEIETTMLYMREPSVPERVRVGRQDFDDVL
jgi:integrase